MAAEDACEHDMLVQIRWQGRKMAVSLSQLEAIGDWHYWVAQAVYSDAQRITGQRIHRAHHDKAATSIKAYMGGW